MSDFGQKHFIRFLKKNGIKHTSIRTASGKALAVRETLPNLYFYFDHENNYVTVGRIPGDNCFEKRHEYSFQSSNAYTILAKLIHYKLVSPAIIGKLKF